MKPALVYNIAVTPDASTADALLIAQALGVDVAAPPLRRQSRAEQNTRARREVDRG